MLADFYKAIADRLATKVPRLNRVTLFNNQIEDAANQYELPTPCALVEFTSIAWSDQGRGIQNGEAVVSVIVASSHLGDFDHGAVGQDQAVSSLRLLDEVHLALQGWGGDQWTAFSRVSTEVDHRRNSVVAHTMSYKCSVVDDTADSYRRLTEVHPTIVVQGDVDLLPPADASVD